MDKNPENSQRKRGLHLENLQPYPPFSATNQPSPEAKKAGWENRKARERFCNEVLFSKFGGQNVLDGVKKKIAKLLLKEKLTPEEAAAFSKTMEFFKTFTPDLLNVVVDDAPTYEIKLSPKESQV